MGYILKLLRLNVNIVMLGDVNAFTFSPFVSFECFLFLGDGRTEGGVTGISFYANHVHILVLCKIKAKFQIRH